MTERAYQWSELPHLARRTLWSMRRPIPDAESERWLLGQLLPREALLYRSMDAVDRAHAIECAEYVKDYEREVIVASALHDVGKTDAGLGTLGRVLATLCGLALAPRARSWETSSGLRRQIARYLDHAERGAAVLERAEAPALAISWAREHHLPVDQRTVEAGLAEVLQAADEL